jgi:hypothetical protein
VASSSRKVRGISCSSSGATQHESKGHAVTTRMIARLLSCDYEAEAALLARPTPGSHYYVPDQTLSVTEAERWGISRECDFFGGVVPFPFVGTKAITHPLPSTLRTVPDGWSYDMARATKPVVLEGYTAFDDSSAYEAGLNLLRVGAIRVKPCNAQGGVGQFTVNTLNDLKRVIARIPHDEGTVLEQQLTSSVTFSVGAVQLEDREISYWGTQSLTRDNFGTAVYGGSRLQVFPGKLGALIGPALNPPTRLAIEQALIYEQAALRSYPGLFMSRRNYDVIQGLDGRGNWKSGVLEQSWRIGGASPAEILAFQALEQAPRKSCLVETVERYGRGHEPPKGAQLIYVGDDPDAGEMIKYAQVLA